METSTQKTQQELKVFLKKELLLQDNTIGSYVSRLKPVAKRLKMSVEEFYQLPFPELKEATFNFLGQDITTSSDPGLRRSSKVYYLFVADRMEKHVMPIQVPYRSEIGQERFLKHRYVSRKGGGKIKSIPGYCSAVNTFERGLGMYDGQIHTISLDELRNCMKRYEARYSNQQNAAQILCKMKTYVAYAEYTYGEYQPKMAA